MTSISVTAAAGRAKLVVAAGDFSPRTIRVDENGAEVALVATKALLLGGDHVRIDLTVGPGAWLDVLETTGTVAYNGDDVPSSWTVHARVAEGGRLHWRGEPLVVATGANVLRDTRIDLGAGAVACLRETLVLGRSGERGGALRNRTRIRLAGEPVLVEDLDLTGERELPGLVGQARVIDTVTLIGVRPVVPDLPVGQYFELAGCGSVARQLLTEAHRSGLDGVYRLWSHSGNGRAGSATGLLHRSH
ncbi:urease accessory protein UreD [Nakamurella silvestris]|nr:urease accessory protein UreD [Nakamurella silvestris]